MTIKKLIICFLVLSVLFCGCQNTADNDELVANAPKFTMTPEPYKIDIQDINGDYQQFFEYTFYVDSDGKNTVIWNEEVYKFDKVTPTQEDFEKIKPDMDFLQVVELVGFYTEYPLYSGIIVTEYECADGQKYSIQWSQNLASQNANEMVVVDITSEK